VKAGTMTASTKDEATRANTDTIQPTSDNDRSFTLPYV
jgi:hypothetical protein